MPLKRSSTLIFVDTSVEAKLAIKKIGQIDDLIILATTPSAQIILSKMGIDSTLYGNLIPNSNSIQEIVDRANEFAMNWFLNDSMKSVLNFQGINLAHYLVGYWTNLIILFLLSDEVIKNALDKYRPKRVLFFKKSFPPDQAINTDYHILQMCGQNLIGTNVKLEAINIEEDTGELQTTQFTKGIKMLIKNRGELDIIFKIIIRRYLRRMKLVKPDFSLSDVLVYGDKHILVNSIDLIKKLGSQFKVRVVGALLSLDQQLILTKAGIKCEVYEDLPVNSSPMAHVDKIKKSWSEFLKSRSYQRMLKKYALIKLEPAVSKAFNEYFTFQMPNVFSTLEQTKKIINTVRPKATILFGNYGKKGLSLSYLTQQIGGKVLILEHGIVPNPIQIHPPVYDKMLFWGDWSRRAFFKAFHEPVEKLGVVGWFLTDNLVREMKKWRQKVNHSHNIRMDTMTVLLLTTFPAYDFPKQLKMVTEVAKSLSKLGIAQLIIRPHPGENMPHELPIKFTSPNFKISWDSGLNLDSQIKRSDLVISEGTSVALRVMMWGKPLLHLVTENIVDYTNFSRFGAAIKISDISQLNPAVEQLAKSRVARIKMLKGQQKQLLDFCFRLDGRAGNRVTKEIRKLI